MGMPLASSPAVRCATAAEERTMFDLTVGTLDRPFRDQHGSGMTFSVLTHLAIVGAVTWTVMFAVSERLPEVHATYLIAPSVLRWVRYKGWRVVEQLDEGERIRIRVRFDSEEEAVQLALAHGADVELIEPTALREVVREAARRTMEKYCQG